MASEIQLRILARKKWFFWPSVIVIACLFKLRIIRNVDPAARWIADHAIHLEVH